MKSNAPDVPDLLRRFLSTPFQSYVETTYGLLRVLSNDDAFSYFPRPYRVSGVPTYECVIVRDKEVPPNPRTLLLEHGELSTVLLADGGHIHFDRDTRELIGFVSPIQDPVLVVEWIERLIALSESVRE